MVLLFKINFMKIKVFFFSLPNRIKYNVDCVFFMVYMGLKILRTSIHKHRGFEEDGFEVEGSSLHTVLLRGKRHSFDFWFVNTLVSKLLMGNLDLCVFIFKKMHTDANVLLAGIIGTISQQPEIG